jgi:hypothetical protein
MRLQRFGDIVLILVCMNEYMKSGYKCLMICCLSEAVQLQKVSSRGSDL